MGVTCQQKSGGLHNFVELKSGRKYCEWCGEPEAGIGQCADADDATDAAMHVIETGREYKVSKFTEALGPIRMPTIEEIYADSRVARWRDIATMPLKRPTVIGCYRRVAQPFDVVGEKDVLFNVWYMRQHDPASGLPLNVYNALATHWAEDVSGAPLPPSTPVG